MPAAFCVAVHGDHVAVGYHGDGIKLFNLDTGVIMCDDLQKCVTLLFIFSLYVLVNQARKRLLISDVDYIDEQYLI